jgi:L-ectoine synthase
VLDEHDEHYLRADAASDMILVSVFNPPLHGTERHALSENGGSAY